MVSLEMKEVKRKYDPHRSRRFCHSKGGHTLPPAHGSLCEKQSDNCALRPHTSALFSLDYSYRRCFSTWKNLH